MSTITWQDALQGVSPITGGQPLPTGTYRFRAVSGVGKQTQNGLSLELQLEVVSGPLQGRKQYHTAFMPNGSTDKDKTSMGYFLGMCEAFGFTGQALGQAFAGRAIDVDTLTYLGQTLVQQGRIVKARVSPQRHKPEYMQVGGWIPDDGIEPDPPKQADAQSTPAAGVPMSPNGFAGGPPNIGGGAPAGLPQGGFPPGAQQAPAAQGGLPLGGFPGSGGAQPNPAPDWATQQPVQGQAPQQFGGPVPGFQGQPNANGQFGAPQVAQVAAGEIGGPGQAAPAAQPQAAGMNQFTQPAGAQFLQPGQQQDPTVTQTRITPEQQAMQGFPGQQFPGQVNPANFPPQNQAQQGFQPPAGLPGGTPPQQGFQPAGQPPQANI